VKTETITELKKFFGEAQTTTAHVLTLPSNISRDQAYELVKDVPLEPVLRDLAVCMARAISSELLAMALRPADYADLPDLPLMVIERLIEALAAKPEDAFIKPLIDHLKMSGG
jgi:hypothetical protein